MNDGRGDMQDHADDDHDYDEGARPSSGRQYQRSSQGPGPGYYDDDDDDPADEAGLTAQELAGLAHGRGRMREYTWVEDETVPVINTQLARAEAQRQQLDYESDADTDDDGDRRKRRRSRGFGASGPIRCKVRPLAVASCGTPGPCRAGRPHTQGRCACRRISPQIHMHPSPPNEHAWVMVGCATCQARRMPNVAHTDWAGSMHACRPPPICTRVHESAARTCKHIPSRRRRRTPPPPHTHSARNCVASP